MSGWLIVCSLCSLLCSCPCVSPTLCFLFTFVLVFCPEPLLPCGQGQGKHALRLRQLRSADAVSAYTQVKIEDAPTLLIIPKSECSDIWIRLPRHKWPKIMVQCGRSSCSSWTESERSSFGRTIKWTAIRESSIGTQWRKFQIGNVSLFIVKKDYSYLCMWMT